MKRYNQRIHAVFSRLQKLDPVRAVVLVGSQTGTSGYPATVFSDIDAYIIVDDPSVSSVENLLPDIVRSCGTVLFCYHHEIGFVAVMDDMQRIELPVVPLSRIRDVFSRPAAQPVKVVFDRTDGILENVLSRRPHTIDFSHLFSKKVYDFWYWQTVGTQYYLKGELYNARSVANIQASAFIWLCELLDNPDLLLLEERKRVEQSLSKKHLALLSRVTPAYKKGQIRASLIQTMDIFPELFRSIHTKYDFQYDTSLEKTVIPKLLQLLHV